MSLIKANGAGESTGFYNNVATQSLRFDSASSAHLTDTLGTPTTRRRWTLSMWIKRTKISYDYSVLFSTGNLICRFSSADTLQLYDFDGNFDINLITTQLFRDTSAWYNLVFVMDIDAYGAGSENDRLKLYSNGTRVSWSGTDPASYDPRWNYNSTHYIGRENTTSNYFDGYMADVNFVDGTALDPTSFGETKNGVWIPKAYTGSYGNNGFRLEFKETGTGTGSSSTIGADTANTNHWDSSGIDTEDCAMPDSVENNFATINPLARSRFSNTGTVSEGNLKYNALSADRGFGFSSIGVASGKWYWEVRVIATGRFQIGVGYESVLAFNGTYFGNNPSKAFAILDVNGNLYYDGTNTAYGSSLSVGDVVMVALDMDNYLCWFGKNGTWFDSATQSEIENSTATNDATTQMGTQQNLNNGDEVFPFMTCQELAFTGGGVFNFGQDPSFAGGLTGVNIGTETPSEGAGVFKYAPPSGYLALCTANISDDDLPISPNAGDGEQSDDYFTPIVYAGNTTDNHLVPASGDTPDSISFAPDWIWIKNLDSAHVHITVDSVRGVNAGYLTTVNTNTEPGNNSLVKTIETSSPFGFTLGTSGAVNAAEDLVAWVWKAGGGPTATNSAGAGAIPTAGSVKIDGVDKSDALAGSIPAKKISASTTAGFSIVTYTGTGASSATIAHGLDAVPKVLIVKNRDAAYNWKVYHESIGNTKYLVLDNADQAQTASSHWNNTTPSSTVFTIGSSNALIRLNDNFVAYCFAEIEGFSKFGSYTGNASTDGTFVYTGFRPAWVLIKDADTNGYNWYLYDNLRKPYNNNSKYVAPNTNGIEIDYVGDSIDHLSNGFKLRTLANGRGTNRSGIKYIYMAFAEAPFKYANAR